MDCEFCQEMASGHCPSLGPSPVGRWIRETMHFVVMPTIGTIQGVRGWMLLTSRDHYRAVGTLPMCQSIELESLMAEVSHYLGSKYDQPVIFFEHGPGTRKGGGACIDHVHMHAVAADLDFAADLEVFSPRPIQSLAELSAIAQRDCPYLFYQNKKGERFVVELQQDVPSQFLRQIAAKQLGVPERYDWAVCPEVPTLLDAVHCACPYCQELKYRNFHFDGINYGNRIFEASPNFCVMPTRGCLVPGYTLIFAKQHMHKVWTSKLAAELEEVMQTIARMTEMQFGVRPVFFEHGSAPRTFPHTHVHSVPLQYSGPPRMGTAHESIQVGSFQALERYGDAATLPWQDSDGRRFLLQLHGPRRSQLLRQVVARELGQPQGWDWREHPFTQNMLRTRDALSKLFAA